MDPKKQTRRDFLGRTAATAAAALIVPRHVLGGPGHTAPNDKLNIACIGIGGKGRSDVQGVAGETIYALCDVDAAQGRSAFEAYPQAKHYRDFREMLAREGDRIDAVTISTPDHVHAVAAITAMQMGKHVFCQKPLTRTIAEARRVAEVARSTGVATQMGIQGHAGEGIRLIREWIEGGLIGTVREVYFWTDRPIWPQALDAPTESEPIPETLEWDLWLGPAADRPYSSAYVPFKWRGWWDFGTGALGDIACHAMDAAFWTLNPGQPEKITAETTEKFPDSPPLCSRITYEFEARGSRPPLRMIWLDGGLLPPRPEMLEEHKPWPPDPNGQLFVGDDGALLAGPNGQDPVLIPESKHNAVMAEPLPQKYPRSPGLYEEWITACKGGQPAGADFVSYAAPLTELVLLGNLAVRTGEIIEWDTESMRVTNAERPNQYIEAAYREGWKLT